MTELQQSLSKCRIEGNTLYLPDIKEGPLPNYPEVRKTLLNAGAKYKRNAFIFPGDARPYIDKLMNGTTVNLKKEMQFFETPDALANYLVELAEIEDGMLVLEPSAGHGNIIAAIYRAFPRIMKNQNDKPCICVDYCELSDLNQSVLSKKINDNGPAWSSRTSFMASDFLKLHANERYERIIANPPFAKNQDIDHIYEMYKACAPGGRIVAIASTHWQRGTNKKETEFRQWLGHLHLGGNHHLIPLDRDSFKQSGANVESVIIIIDKPTTNHK